MTTLKFGSVGVEVTQLQKRLNSFGATLQADGHFGAATQAAVIQYQKSNNLVADGIAGAKTLSALFAARDARHLSQAALAKAAKKLDADLAAVMAVNKVESRGQGFLPNGKPVILFERHIMLRRLEWAIEQDPTLEKILPRNWRSNYPALINRQPGGYMGGVGEHVRLASARQIHDASALESASWGLFQIMGFHWQLLGYESAADFVSAMHQSEEQQLDAFVRFVIADPAMHKALKAHRWAEFARRYNGSNYSINNYDKKLKSAFDYFTRVLS